MGAGVARVPAAAAGAELTRRAPPIPLGFGAQLNPLQWEERRDAFAL